MNYKKSELANRMWADSKIVFFLNMIKKLLNVKKVHFLYIFFLKIMAETEFFNIHETLEPSFKNQTILESAKIRPANYDF